MIKIWTPHGVFEILSKGPKKLAKQAADVRSVMIKNREILIEGQVPERVLEEVF